MKFRSCLALLYAFSLVGFSPPLWAQSKAGPFPISSASSPCARITVTANATVGIQVIGIFSATLQPEVSVQGQSPQNTQVTPSTSNTAQATITAAGVYSSGVGGFDTFLVCVTSYVSGTATIYLNTTTAVNAGLLGSGSSLPTGSVINNTALATPTAPTVTQVGTPGSTSVGYQVVALNAIGMTLGSGITTTAFSNSTLTVGNYNNVQTAAVAGSTSCWAYRTTTAQIPHTTGWIGSVACGGTLSDTGLNTDGPQNTNGTLPYGIATNAGMYVPGNLSVGSLGGLNTSPETPLIVYDRLAVGANASTAVPANAQFYVPGTPTPGILLADGPGSIGNSLFLWSATPGGTFAPQIVQMMSGGTLAAPDNTWGGGGIADINSVGYIGGAVNDWRVYTIQEYGSADSGNPTTDTPHGKIQLGIVNGPGSTPSVRPGFVVVTDATYGPRTTNTNGTPFWLYNLGSGTGLPNVYNIETGNSERAELNWSSNTFLIGPTASGTGTLRPMQFTGSSLISTTQHLAASTACTGNAPAYSFSSDTGVGTGESAGNGLLFCGVSGQNTARVGSSLFELHPNAPLKWGSSDALSGADTGVSRDAAGVVAVGTGPLQNESGFLRSANTCRITADVSLTVNVANPFCSFSLPATAFGWGFHCDVLWTETAGTGTNTFSLGVNPSQTPTAATNVSANIWTTQTGTSTQGVAALSASGATNILTSPTYTPVATIERAEASGTILANATAGTFAIIATAAGTTVTGAIKAGSTCELY